MVQFSPNVPIDVGVIGSRYVARTGTQSMRISGRFVSTATADVVAELFYLVTLKGTDRMPSLRHVILSFGQNC